MRHTPSRKARVRYPLHHYCIQLQRAEKAAGSIRNISGEQECRCLYRVRGRFPEFIILSSLYGIESILPAAEFIVEETGKDKFREIQTADKMEKVKHKVNVSSQ